MEPEDESNMVFDRSQTWKVDNENNTLDLLQALELSGEDYMRKDDSGNETCNLRKMQNVLQKYAVDDMNNDEFKGERNRFMSN